MERTGTGNSRKRIPSNSFWVPLSSIRRYFTAEGTQFQESWNCRRLLKGPRKRDGKKRRKPAHSPRGYSRMRPFRMSDRICTVFRQIQAEAAYRARYCPWSSMKFFRITGSRADRRRKNPQIRKAEFFLPSRAVRIRSRKKSPEGRKIAGDLRRRQQAGAEKSRKVHRNSDFFPEGQEALRAKV